MVTTVRQQRPKAFIGTAISVGTQLIGGIIGGAKKRKAEKAAQLEAERRQKMDNAQQQASILTQQVTQNEEVYDDIRNQLMKKGGKANLPRKEVTPVITEGGSAMPIGNNSYLLRGRKHNEGGIVIGKGKNSIEAEAGEVVKIDKKDKEMKILSTLPLTRSGLSPAAKAISNPKQTDSAFKEQESFKREKGITNSRFAKKGTTVELDADGNPIKKVSKFAKFLDKNGDAISSGIGAVGSLISGFMNKSSINNIQAPQKPQLIAPAKLKTTINVNPQLSDINENELTTRRDIAGNTASSVASLARRQRVSNASLSERNRIRGEKENIETQLQNQDAMNRQSIAAQNAATTNAHNNIVTQIENDKIQALANNRTAMIDSVTGAVRDYQLGRDKKKMDKLRLAVQMSATPEQVDLFEKNMDKNMKRLSKMSYLYRCGGKRKTK